MDAHLPRSEQDGQDGQPQTEQAPTGGGATLRRYPAPGSEGHRRARQTRAAVGGRTRRFVSRRGARVADGAVDRRGGGGTVAHDASPRRVERAYASSTSERRASQICS